MVDVPVFSCGDRMQVEMPHTSVAIVLWVVQAELEAVLGPAQDGIRARAGNLGPTLERKPTRQLKQLGSVSM